MSKTMKKKEYKPLVCERVGMQSRTSILSGSVIMNDPTIIIPHGQKVDTYDFSTSSSFSYDWSVEDPI